MSDHGSRGERTDVAHAQEALTNAGFRIVMREPVLRGAPRLKADVVAWASNSDGELVPWAVVEVKRGSIAPLAAVPTLNAFRENLGTADHYAVVNGDWYKADRALQALERVDGPTPPPHGADGIIRDADLAPPVGHRLGESAVERITEAYLLSLMSREALWDVRRRDVAALSRHRRWSEHASHPVIAEAVTGLLGARIEGDILDPFCGSGAFLWSVADRAAQGGTSVRLHGRDINEQAVEIARTVGDSAGVSVDIRVGNALMDDLLMVDAVVSAPPFGLRLYEPHQLLNGSTTVEMEPAAVDVALRHLKPEGRAVLHLMGSFTSRKSVGQYRAFLAENYRIAAVIGCPPGAVPGTNVASTLLVLDNAAPGKTFAGQAGEDWATQLLPGGALLEAAMAHIDGDLDPRP